MFSNVQIPSAKTLRNSDPIPQFPWSLVTLIVCICTLACECMCMFCSLLVVLAKLAKLYKAAKPENQLCVNKEPLHIPKDLHTERKANLMTDCCYCCKL